VVKFLIPPALESIFCRRRQVGSIPSLGIRLERREPREGNDSSECRKFAGNDEMIGIFCLSLALMYSFFSTSRAKSKHEWRLRSI